MSQLWREATDPSTGRTYYYHAISRETTWTKPGEVQTLGDQGGMGSNTSGDRRPESVPHKLIDSFATIRAKFGHNFVTVLGQVKALQQFKVLLSGSSGEASRAQCLTMLVGGFDSSNKSAQAVADLGILPVLLELGLGNDGTNADSKSRVQAIHILCRAAVNPTCHTGLKDSLPWDRVFLCGDSSTSSCPLATNDKYRGQWDLRLCVLLALMITGPCGDDMRPNYLHYLNQRITFLLEAVANGEGAYLGPRGDGIPLPLCGTDIEALFQLSFSDKGPLIEEEQGGRLLRQFLAWYLSLLCQDYDEAERFLSLGGTSLLQVLCLERTCPTVRKAALHLVLDLMQKHQAVGSQMVESWMSLAGDLSRGLLGASSPRDVVAQATRSSEIDSTLADITLEVGSSRLPAHKSVLAARCPYFRDYLSQHPDHTVIALDQSILPESLAPTLLLHLYTGTGVVAPGGDPNQGVAMLRSAYHLGLEGLMGMCHRVLASSLSLLDSKGIQAVMEAAEECQCEPLQKACQSILQDHKSGALLTSSTQSRVSTSLEVDGGGGLLLPADFEVSPGPGINRDAAETCSYSTRAMAGDTSQVPVTKSTKLVTGGKGPDVETKTDKISLSRVSKKVGGGEAMAKPAHPAHGSIYRALMKDLPPEKAKEEEEEEGANKNKRFQSTTTAKVNANATKRLTTTRTTKASTPTAESASLQVKGVHRVSSSSSSKINPRRATIGGGGISAQEFIESVHSLRPPPQPELDEAKKRAEFRALPKQVQKTIKDNAWETRIGDMAMKKKDKGASTIGQAAAVVEGVVPLNGATKLGEETALIVAPKEEMVKEKLRLLKSRRGSRTSSVTSMQLQRAWECEDEASVGSNNEHKNILRPPEGALGTMVEELADTVEAGTMQAKEKSPSSSAPTAHGQQRSKRMGAGYAKDKEEDDGARKRTISTTRSSSLTATSQVRRRSSGGMEHTEGEVNKLKEGSTTMAAAVSSSTSKWRAQSEAFRNMLRANRGEESRPLDGEGEEEVGKGGGLLFSPPVDMSLTQCPHCSRRFNEAAAERHIPICATTKNKAKPLLKGQGHLAANASTTRR